MNIACNTCIHKDVCKIKSDHENYGELELLTECDHYDSMNSIARRISMEIKSGISGLTCDIGNDSTLGSDIENRIDSICDKLWK